jgi:hypothetical protein
VSRARVVLTSLAAVAAMCGALSAAATSNAAGVPPRSSSHDRLEVLAGSPKYLVYLKYPGKRPFPSFGNIRRPVYVLGRSGPPQRLAAIAPDSSVSIAGSMVIAVRNGDDANLLRWWNLRTRQHGSVRYSIRGSVILDPVAATPTGWVLSKWPVLSAPPDPHRTTELESVVAGGSTTDLGVPYPDGSSFDVVDGADGSLASAGCRAVDTTCSAVFDGAVKWLAYTDPTNATTLLGTSTDRRIACGAPLNGLAACATRRLHDAGSSTMRLMPTDGSTPVTTKQQCPFARPAILGRSAAWIVLAHQGCPAGHLVVLSMNGSSRVSTRTFSRQAVFSALGRIIVRSTSGRMLESLSGVDAVPEVLVSTL